MNATASQDFSVNTSSQALASVKVAVIVFPASNCDRDVARAFTMTGQAEVEMVWHNQNYLPNADIVVLPGGFSYGDYLRAGAISARAPIMKAVADHAAAGGLVIGICNGFQILTETGLLPGTLLRNQKLHFISRSLKLRVIENDTVFTQHYQKNQILDIPVAHHDGNYFAAPEDLQELAANRQILLRYEGENPNGSCDSIAGVCNRARNVFGLMPHPERAMQPSANQDTSQNSGQNASQNSGPGAGFFTSLCAKVQQQR